MQKTRELKIVSDDTLRYKKNKLPALLALLGLVFNCLYFCLLYGLISPYFSKITIGISVVLTLLTLLTMFLSSEGIKAYKKVYCIVLLVLAVIQIVRIFGIPLDALKHDNGVTLDSERVMTVNYFWKDISSGTTFAFLVIWLVLSAASLVASAVLGYINCVRLEKHQKAVANGDVSIEETLKTLDIQDEERAKQEAEAKAQAAEAQPAEEEVQ